MKISELKNLFEKKSNPELFKQKIETEVLNYKKLSNKKGTSIPIYIEEDIQGYKIFKDDIVFLCNAYLDRIFDKWELNYIAEALVLCENVVFENEKVEFAIHSLSDSEYDKLISDKFINQIISEL